MSDFVNNKRTLLIAIVIIATVLLILIIFGSTKDYRKRAQNGAIYCATDVKLCPDETYVSRIPPDCDFQSCNAEIVDGKLETMLHAKIDQGASGLDVKIVPTEVLEDSRCPLDVNCIQAGTVKIKAILESGLGKANQVFQLSNPITTEAEEITLVKVLPEKYSSKKIDSSDYEFTFKVRKR